MKNKHLIRSYNDYQQRYHLQYYCLNDKDDKDTTSKAVTNANPVIVVKEIKTRLNRKSQTCVDSKPNQKSETKLMSKKPLSGSKCFRCKI